MTTEQSLIEELARVTAERDQARRALNLLRQERDFAQATGISWQRIRVQAAIAAMQGMLACGGWDASRVALVAVDYADALATELQKEVAK